MRGVLVDSSVWIDYFRGAGSADRQHFEELIDSNSICINDIILAELSPPLLAQKKHEVIDILKIIRRIPLVIDWDEIINLQVHNLRHGLNRVGIPDLIILQNSMQNDLPLFTLDSHFRKMCKLHSFILHK